MEYKITNADELTHWGIKGMRWGIRRYQNKDGSLTSAGKKRLQKEAEALKKEEQVLKNRKATKAKIDRLAAKRKTLEDQKKELDDATSKKTKKGKTDDATPAKKSIKDMTDEELASSIRRAQLEQQYSALIAKPEPVAKGNSFVKDFWDKAAVPAIQEAGKGLLKDSITKMGKKYLGLNTENADDYVTKLGKEVKKMTLEKQYKKLKEEAAEGAQKTAESKETAQLKKDVEELKTTVSDSKRPPAPTSAAGESYATDSAAANQPVKVAVHKKTTTSAGEDYVKNSGLESSDWQEFKKKYPWGVESYATDRVDD